MSQTERIRLPGFWPTQVIGWVVLYALVLVPALPHVHEQGVFAYNSWAVLLMSGASFSLRPVLRYALGRWSSWLPVEAFAFAACLVTGTVASFATFLLTYGSKSLGLRSWSLSGVQCTMVLFLWATLYISVKGWKSGPDTMVPAVMPSRSGVQEKILSERPAYTERFVARVGSRLQIVTADQVLWIAAARDYAELHTQNSVHLVRETIASLQKNLDPERFIRIHRSRIVRVDQITELITLENNEYRVRLSDGSEHRSSRTYGPALARWMRPREIQSESRSGDRM